jgi:hypothetical protein
MIVDVLCLVALDADEGGLGTERLSFCECIIERLPEVDGKDADNCRCDMFNVVTCDL